VGVNQSPEQQAGTKVKNRRTELGMSQEAVAEEMRRLGHSWHQTTVAKTEVAGRPLRLNELTDLARILGVRASHLAATETDMWLEMVQNNTVAYSGHLARLKEEIDELTERLAEKKETFERVQKLLRESQKEFEQLYDEYH
jgi:transcriptional regulator with XRE-family HTH domain